jgi:hypothetical protein
MIEYVCTGDGIPTGTRFEFNPYHSSLVIITEDSRGVHEVELGGVEVMQLRNFLAERITATGRSR